ncbi:MAG: hypothetical protein AAGB14_14190 [Verrucomicrobiota bacterium]
MTACTGTLQAQSINLSAKISASKLELTWDAVIGRSYAVERADKLDNSWTTVATVVADTATETWTDPDDLDTKRFYRLSYDDQPGNVLFTLPDGDFESGGGLGTGWFQATPFDNSPRIVSSALPYLVAPRSGTHFAALGGYFNLDPSTSNNQTVIQYNQSIQLPPLQPVYLHVWYQLVSQETDPFADVFNLWLADILATGPFCNTNILLSPAALTTSGNTNGWTRASFNLTPYAGQVICLAFEVRTNFFAHSALFLDDISFRDAP